MGVLRVALFLLPASQNTYIDGQHLDLEKSKLADDHHS